MCVALLFSAPATAQTWQSEQDWDSGDAFVKTHGFSEAYCFANSLCSQQLEYQLPAGLDVADVLLTGWYVRATDGSDRFRRLRVAVTKVDYDPGTGFMEANATIRADPETSQVVEYGLTWMVIAGDTGSVHLTSANTLCDTDDTSVVCDNQSTISNAIPTTGAWRFLGFGMRDIEFTQNTYVDLVQLVADVSNSGLITGTANALHEVTCGWVGGTSVGLPTDRSCRVRSVGVSVESSNLTPLGTATEGTQFTFGNWFTTHTQSAAGADGVLSLFQRYYAAYSDGSQPAPYHVAFPGAPVEGISGGCQFMQYPYVYDPSEFALQFSANLTQNGFTPMQHKEVKCGLALMRP